VQEGPLESAHTREFALQIAGRVRNSRAPAPVVWVAWPACPGLHKTQDAAARDLNQPNSERGVGHLEALGNALGKLASSTTNRPGGHGNEEKAHFLARSAVV
jgi:hypothetical protein